MFFKNIEIENFLSLGLDNKISFNSDSVTFIKGVNLDTNGSNGSGKSTIIEAIVWCLFGRTIRGVSADDVVNYKNKKNTKVSIEIDDYKITRYRKHHEHKNTLIVKKGSEEITLGTVRESTKVIEDIFNITYETFINSIVLGANVNVNFLSAGSNADRRKIFENLLDINNFSDFQKECKEKEATICIDITEFDTKKSSTQEFLSNLIIKKSENETKLLLWEDNKKKELFELRSKLGDLEAIDLEPFKIALLSKSHLINEEANIRLTTSPIISLVKNLSGQIESNERELKELDKIKGYDFEGFKKKYSDMIQINVDIHKFDRAKIKIKSELDLTKHNLDDLQMEMVDATKFLGEPCPTCGTLLDQENLKQLSISYHDKIVEKEAKIAELEKKYDLVKEKIAQLEDTIEQMTPELSEVEIGIYEGKLSKYDEIKLTLKSQLDERAQNTFKLQKVKDDLVEINAKIAEIKIEKTEGEIRSIENDIVTTKNTIELKEKETNPYKNTDIADEIKKYEDKIIELEGLINIQQEDMKYWTFWKDAFGNKGLKIHIFDSVIPFFNNRIQFYLDILSNGKFRLVFDKDLSYEIEGTKYNNNSSGEKKRVDLAVMIALFDLLNLRTSSSSNILILDEVLDSLDEIGVESVQELLIELNKRIKNIFVISHNNNLSENFSNILTVVKEDEISQIVH